jgi:hypothetical protein
MTDLASAPLPLSVRNQDGLECWTKRARLIARVLISARENWRAGPETRPYGAIPVMRDMVAAAAMEPAPVSPPEPYEVLKPP